MDFTIRKYRELVQAFVESGYRIVTVRQYLESAPSGKVLALRHDVDEQPQNALKMAEAEKELPDLLLLDYEMPEMNGADVLRQIRSNPKWKDLAVVFLTGTEDKENVRKAESLHPEGFLVKTMGKAGLLMGIAAFFD